MHFSLFSWRSPIVTIRVALSLVGRHIMKQAPDVRTCNLIFALGTSILYPGCQLQLNFNLMCELYNAEIQSVRNHTHLIIDQKVTNGFFSWWQDKQCLCEFCLFFKSVYVCLGIYRLTREFSLIWKRHHYRWMAMLGTHGHRAVRVLKRSTPTVTGTSVYNGHLPETLTLTPIAERLAAEL